MVHLVVDGGADGRQPVRGQSCAQCVRSKRASHHCEQPAQSTDGHADDDDEAASYAPVHYLEDHRFDPARELEATNWEADSHDRLGGALEALDARSRTILQRRWLDENKATLHELAAQFGVSAERIRQLEQAAMKKLRLSMGN